MLRHDKPFIALVKVISHNSNADNIGALLQIIIILFFEKAVSEGRDETAACEWQE